MGGTYPTDMLYCLDIKLLSYVNVYSEINLALKCKSCNDLMIVVCSFFSPSTAEYRAAMAEINREMATHNKHMVRARPEFNMCDLAVQV